jgi:clan AA aspartic protease
MRALASTLQLAHRRRVGTTHLDLRISNPADPSRRFERRLIVDSGAVYTIVPGPLLREIGIEPDRVQRFELADGRVVTREVGSAVYELRKLRAAAPVIFGKRTDVSLLGVVTLEALGLTIDPLRRKLRAMRPMLL